MASARTPPIKITRLVERGETVITRTALERASWRCEGCQGIADLRVVEDRYIAFVVLCAGCRLGAGWVPGARARARSR